MLAHAIHLQAADPLTPTPDPAVQLDYQNQIAPLMQRLCVDCHAGDNAGGGMAIEKLDPKRAATVERALWKKIVTQVDAGIMPPADASVQPTPEERKQIVAWITDKALPIQCNGPVFPGRVTIRRLNRSEYNNTVRDLLGVTLRPADNFPSDDVGYGFDNIGDVLSVPPVLLERYLDAAEQLTAEAIVAPDPELARVKEFPAPGNVGYESTFDYDFTAAASYVLKVSAYGDQVGDEPCRLLVRIDDKDQQQIDVPASGSPAEYQVPLRSEGGHHKVVLRFVNDYYQPNHADPKYRGDRNLFIVGLALAGPIGVLPGQLPESHRKLLTMTPPAASTRALQRSAAKMNLKPLMSRAFRRPVTDAELDRTLKLVDMVLADGGSFERGIMVGIQSVLVSPEFLFKIEGEPTGTDPLAVRQLNGYELATRLSYFLWSSMPDQELLQSAQSGKLVRPVELEKQTRRMLADSRTQALVENFTGQWLQLRNLKNFQPDPRQYPGFDDALRTAMRRETELLFQTVLREDHDLSELLSADYTFLNQRLARHYGIGGVEGDEFRRVPVDRTQRGGLLTQASILSVTSNPTRTSPVKRGKWILENLLAAPPPPAPPNVPALNENRTDNQQAVTLRERLELHRANAACASCHTLMDPLGFGLENYDPVGAWRTQEKDGGAVDATGTLPDGRSFHGSAELRDILLVRKAEFRRCLVEKLMTYGLGRGLEYFDECVVRRIGDEVDSRGNKLNSLIVSIVLSEPFRQRARVARPDLAIPVAAAK